MNDAFKGKYVKLTSRFLVGPVSYGKETLGHSPLLSRLAHLVMITCMHSLYHHAWPLGYCCHLSGHSNSKLSTLGETLGHFPPPSSCSGTSMGQLGLCMGLSWCIFVLPLNPDGYSVAAVILSAQQLWVLSTSIGLPSTYLDGMKMCRGLLLGITISVDYVVLIVTCPGSNK